MKTIDPQLLIGIDRLRLETLFRNDGRFRRRHRIRRMLPRKLDFRREGSSIEATNVQLVLVVESAGGGLLIPRATRVTEREVDDDGGTFTLPTLDLDVSTVLGDDAVTHAQAEPRSPVVNPGGEERIEGVAYLVLRHPAAAILDTNPHLVVRP